MNTLLLIGGDLCERVAHQLDTAEWQCLGLRRRLMPASPASGVVWHQADLTDQPGLSRLGYSAFANVTHILYAPSPDRRTEQHYADAYPLGLRNLLNSLPPATRERLQRCILVGSTAVWAPTDEWVDENTPVQRGDFRADALLDAESTLHAMLAPGAGVALRLSGLYGPHRLHLVKGLRAGTIAAPDGPGHWANRIHIDDAAQACVHLFKLAQPHPLYIGTDNHPTPTAEFYDAVAHLIGARPPARRPQPPSGKRLSNARLRASGWTPAWPSAVVWYGEHVG